MESIHILLITATELQQLIVSAINEALDAKLTSLIPTPPAIENGLEYLTRHETAALLHVTVLTLRKWEKRGILRPQRISRRVLYPKVDVLAVLNQSRLQRRAH
ncbi:MAG: Helix-turn-helix domain [Chlorobi bacterium]|nr:Helix-turn-helix domain [Chlorobiota bacterium]